MIHELNEDEYQYLIDAPLYLGLRNAFAAAAKPYIHDALKKEGRVDFEGMGKRETVKALAFMGAVKAFFKAVDLFDLMPHGNETREPSVEEAKANKLGVLLADAWLKNAQALKRADGSVFAAAILPGAEVLEEKILQAGNDFAEFLNIDIEMVVRDGLTELAKARRDIELPNGMTLNRKTLHDALKYTP